MRYSLIDQHSYYWTALAFLIAWALFSWEVGSIADTFVAALMSGAIFWISYTLVRWIILALKR